MLKNPGPKSLWNFPSLCKTQPKPQLILIYYRKSLTSEGVGIYKAVLQNKTSQINAREILCFMRCGAAERVAMLHKRTLLVVVVFSLAFSVCPLLYGQATGSFSGTVSDKAGAV